MSAYYNEIEPFAAQWLRNLISKGLIADGEVDERSIADVKPDDLIGFTQCHFFAGIGVWSYALRCAGWSDDRPVWTGSCPCQPFSSAGKGKGFDDERHLFPHFHWLISQCRPELVFGEQVANKAGESWFDIVQVDLAGEGYTAGLVVFPACGVGAPHQRKRLYWVAENTLVDTTGKRAQPESGVQLQDGTEFCSTGATSELAHAELHGHASGDGLREASESSEQEGAQCVGEFAGGGDSDDVAHSGVTGLQGRGSRGESTERGASAGHSRQSSPDSDAGPTNGLWRDADWLYCRDDKWRATQSTDERLADGIADSLGYCRIRDRYSLNPLVEKAENRVGRLKGYGNAIVAPQAQEFIEAYMEI